mmetsp:Transcript_1598/g.4725  ORF Transcript_1598/g.4725 Transcript_1598/m.4725 type:complete len:388 (-) Transcript_1598:176-1339(-)
MVSRLSSASAPPFGSLDSIERLGIVNVKKEELRVKHGHSTYNNNNVNNGVEDSHRLIEKPAPVGNLRGVANIVILDFVNVLLLAWPLGCASYFLEWGEIWTFWLNFLAMIPLAKILGDATEELAAGLHNDTVGGLLNATFGNAVEMIITISAIREGLLEIVKKSLLGSILSNLLLVLGMAFFFGGLTRSEQRFPGAAALINITMLLVGIMSFSLPTVFSMSAPEHAILDSRYGFGLYMRAKELVEGGEAARGIEAMEGGYLRFNPLNTHALYDMADVLGRSSEFGLAAGYLERVLHAAGPDDDISSQVLDFLVRAGEAERARDFGGKFLKQLRRVRGQKPKPAAGSRPLLFMRHESGEQEFKAALVRGKEVKEALALLSDQAADGEL